MIVNANMQNKRLQDILLKDKMENPDRLNSILKSELKNVLHSFFEIEDDCIDLSIVVDESGFFDLRLSAKAKRIKGIWK